MPQVAPPVRGFLEQGCRNKPLYPLAETIRGRLAYGNGETKFSLYVEEKDRGRIHLQLIQEVRREESPYRIFCVLQLEPGTIRIEDIQNIYPGCFDPTHPEPDLVNMHDPPLPEWKGLGFFSIILKHVKGIAAEKGICRITIDPDNTDLREYYSGFGFAQAPEKESRMQLVF
ncbi:MAG: hypothetical protein PHQ80_02680 [Candidatus ainarchaeum sp.]|nr:hypothetical protein [Candidatus ainarchaeum sp.]MDD5096662.1 hypothetical protein [Candidatus ainarchaeum sp.]